MEHKNYIVALLLSFLLVLVGLFTKVDQRIYIKKDLSLSTDTITADDTRFYYNRVDSTSRTIRLVVYKDLDNKPYIVKELQPSDYVDLNIKPGYNIFRIQELGQYPTREVRIKVTRIKEVK